VTVPGTGQDYYGLLGVSRDASTPEIRRAYRRLARQHHPDRNPHPDSSARFRAVADAYAILNDPTRRARYDHTSRPAPPPRPQHEQPLVLPRRGTLELSAREAHLAAAAPLKLTAPPGIVIVLPAGVRDGDRIIIDTGTSTTVLTVRVNQRLDIR
jgi:curved DNA-binding protein CbpA